MKQIGQISISARMAIEHSEHDRLGQLLNENHALLQEMEVSSSELDRLVAAAKQAGALGAKLSGGGRGGNMIAMVASAQAKAVAQALQIAGAVRTITTEVGK